MGVKERQEREREAVSRSILDAARDLFVAEGYHNVSIRKIAERIEYSPAAIYGYFPSKDDIFFALAEEGFRTLLAMPAAKVDEADDLKAIRNAFWRVYEFSKSHPEYFALMFVDRTVPRINKDWQRFGFVHEMKARLGARIQRAIDAGHFPAGTEPDAVFRILSDGHPRRRGLPTVRPGHAGRGPGCPRTRHARSGADRTAHRIREELRSCELRKANC